MDWSDLKYFLAVARLGSLTDASKFLRTSASTVARRVTVLEESLGRRLFARRPDGYVLNETGQKLLKHAEEVEGAVAALERDATASDLDSTGLVSVAVPELLGNEFILPRLSPLFAQHPGITLEFLSNVMPVRLSHRISDIALRVVRPAHGDYLLTKAGQLALALYASRDYIASFGQLLSTADLTGHRIAGWTKEYHFLQHVDWMEKKIQNRQAIIRTTNMTAQFRAANSGLCIAMLPVPVAEEAGLIRIATEMEPLVLDLWLAINNETQTTPRVRTVANFLKDMLATNAKLLNPPG